MTVRRESPGVSWLEVESPRFVGYAVLAGSSVEAINFELDDADADSVLALIAGAAGSIGWEVHENDDEDVEDGDD